MRKQTNTDHLKMSRPTNNWILKRTEHRFYAEIVTNITTQRKKEKR